MAQDLETIQELVRLEKIIQLKERYRTLSRIHEFFPSKGSQHRVCMYVNVEMDKAIEDLEELQKQ